LQVAPLERANGAGIDGAYLYSRETTFDDGQSLEAPRYDRGQLRAEHRVPGPSIIIQHNSTVLIPPGYVADVTEYGNLRLTRSG
jgi:N-methylhydantoinase A